MAPYPRMGLREVAMEYSNDLEVDDPDEAADLSDEIPAPVSAIAHVSHASGHEPLMPATAASSDADQSSNDARAARAYRRT